MTARAEHAALLALTEAASPRPWYEVADLVESAGSALSVADGSHQSYVTADQELVHELAGRTTDEMVEHWSEVLEATLAGSPETSLVTVLDKDYPANLRKIYNRPPFLFVRGTLDTEDVRSVAIVGTRKASPEGIRLAKDLATALTGRRVTVISGMAAGIDTAAHQATLDAGGRTIAVMGNGIDKVYPAANRGLSEQIAARGALLSQFWPGSPPRSQNFPLRNVVTSGTAVGTVVIEANATSGAKMQARLALEHGKRLFLVRSLVMHEEWAQRYSRRPGAVVVDSVDDILTALESERETVTELQLF